MSNSYRIDAARYTEQDFAATGPFEKQLKRATSRDPGDRPADFDEWRDALLAAHRRFVKRRRGIKVAAAMGLVALTAAAWLLAATDDQQESTDPVGPSTASIEADDPTSTTTTTGQSTTTTTTASQSTTAALDQTAMQIAGLGGLCLDVPNQTFRDGQNLWMWDCNDTIAQEWTIAGDRITVEGYCLDIEGPLPSAGAALQIWECEDVPQQRWQTTTEGEIVSTWNGLCVSVAFADPNRGAAIQMESCDGSDGQRWLVP